MYSMQHGTNAKHCGYYNVYMQCLDMGHVDYSVSKEQKENMRICKGVCNNGERCKLYGRKCGCCFTKLGAKK